MKAEIGSSHSLEVEHYHPVDDPTRNVAWCSPSQHHAPTITDRWSGADSDDRVSFVLVETSLAVVGWDNCALNVPLPVNNLTLVQITYFQDSEKICGSDPENCRYLRELA